MVGLSFPCCKMDVSPYFYRPTAADATTVATRLIVARSIVPTMFEVVKVMAPLPSSMGGSVGSGSPNSAFVYSPGGHSSSPVDV